MDAGSAALVRRIAELGRDDVELAGGKGANLGELVRGGFPVPPGFVLTTAAHRAFVTESGIGDRLLALAADPDIEAASARIRGLIESVALPERIAEEIAAAVAELGPGPFAVRSSATAEDLADASFAGQQDTYLNVRADDLSTAVQRCWASLWTARAMAYRARLGIAPAAVALAVVVQRMVPADAAGVVCTANPVNGRRTETVVSAAWGLGEAVVSGTVTPDDLVVDPAEGKVRSRTTAEKRVITVATDDGTREEELTGPRRTAAVLDDAAAIELARLGAAIAAHFGAPQDIEWARAGGEFAIVQSRPITALPEPAGPVPTEWPVPDDAIYVRASIVEQLPDPLTPLFAELVDASVGRTLPKLMRESFGDDAVQDGEISLPTINGYAYYRYPRPLMRKLILQSVRAVRALVGAGPARWRDVAHPRYRRIVAEESARSLPDLSDAELLDSAIRLLDAGTEYYTAVQTIIPQAASSELALARFYDALVRRPDAPPATTLLLGFDSAPIRAETSLYDLAVWTRSRPEIAEALLTSGPEDLPPGPDGDEWWARFQAHLDAYGHTTYTLDFATAVPADDPAPLLETLRFYLRGDGTDPRERQARSARRRDELTAQVVARLDPLRRAAFTKLLGWAQCVAPLREDALADIGLAWPQLRRVLRELGRRCVAAGVIDEIDDVFWLRQDELLTGRPRQGEVARRKEIWRGQRRATPPQTLPQGTLMDRFEAFLPANPDEQTGAVLTGTGASGGSVTAPARVLSGPADFGRMQPGDVLVAGITTPAWTPLFAMASAVVTDIGGPLSHSSIVAREYGIPAVLGTGVATKRIPDGARVRVDGDAGTVTLLDEEPAVPGAVPQFGTGVPGWAFALATGAAVAGLVALARKRRRR
ncbi:PEP/pyruvate-binding domain-containing protein [Pseudonocardia thermophila]|uniref:PEP/pyruvate-binding domain-containing protein n=1 Tax=Pseudonocardia thermophila TaxID=1848 RepID=UPI00248E3436|nr:PEP/pyruvate-binding domain-containing protein [Pseudonocardia thermophila]